MGIKLNSGNPRLQSPKRFTGKPEWLSLSALLSVTISHDSVRGSRVLVLLFAFALGCLSLGAVAGCALALVVFVLYELLTPPPRYRMFGSGQRRVGWLRSSVAKLLISIAILSKLCKFFENRFDPFSMQNLRLARVLHLGVKIAHSSTPAGPF